MTRHVTAIVGGVAVALAVATASPVHAQDSTRTRAGYVLLSASTPTPAPLAVMVEIAADSLPLADVVNDIVRRAKIGIVYDRTLPGLGRRITLRSGRVTAADALLRALDGTQLDALVSPSGQVVLVRHVSRPGRVRGIVLDSAGVTVGRARVDLEGTGFATASADDGSFTFARIPPGNYRLRVRRLGYRPGSGVVRLVDGDADLPPTVVTLETAPIPLSAVVVSPGYFSIMGPQQATTQTLDHEQIRTRPQLGDDLFRSINRLAGLSSSDFIAGFHVRGSEVDQMYVTLDGVQLFEPFHLKDVGGVLSILDVQSVSGIDLTTAGFTTEYGGRLGSVLAIRSTEPSTGDMRTTVGLSITNLRLQSEGGFAGGRGSWVVAARRGYLDLALKLAGPGDSLSPVYSDVFAKVAWTIGERNRVALHALHAGDALRYADDEGVIESGYGSHYAWVTWDTQPTERLTGTSVWSASGLSWLRTGMPRINGNRDSEVHDRRGFTDFTVRDDWTWALSDRAMIKWGGDAHASRASYDYHGLHVSRVVDRDTLATVSNTVSSNFGVSGTTLGAYLAPRIVLAAWLTAEAGARVDRVSYSGDALVSPRVNLVATLGPSASVRFAMGRYNQPEPIYALHVQDGVTQFGAADLADTRVLGLEQRFGAATARIEAYERRTVRERPRYINLQANNFIFPEFSFDRRLHPATTGRARGVEVMAQHSAATGVEWSASYSLATTTDDVDGVAVPRTYDQRHTAYVDASYRPEGASWRMSAAWQVHSGWPEAPPLTFTVDTLRNARPNLFVTTTYGPLTTLGTSRLPWYHRLDLRLTRDVRTARGTVSFFADIFNVFNAPNLRNTGFFTEVRNGQVVVTPSFSGQIGRFPSVGISWTF